MMEKSVFLVLCIIAWLFIPVYSQNTETLCATLRPTSNEFKNESLTIKSGSAFGNLANDFLSSKKSWNITASWSVQQNCELKACSGAYLSGQCETYRTGASSTSSTWLSSVCKCDLKCTCSSDKIDDSVCARAYFAHEPDSCNNCYSPYIELIPGNHDTFPEQWSEKISSILVRPGCTLTLSDEEDLEGEQTEIIGPSHTNTSEGRPIKSYECKCDPSGYNIETTQIPSLDAFFPTQVDIPTKLDDVVGKLAANNYNHPGLLAAVSSLMRRRSSKNFYILLIGSSGAGKSSMINILLKNPNATEAGGVSSTTSEILEFRAPLPIPEKGIANTELRIIDTPGLGDTRGLTNDAQFLATLEDYLENHEELSSKLPNLVLILHNFIDNRFDGETAAFVKMIRGLDSLREKITDKDYSNVLFVFSHFCSAGASVIKNPTAQLLRYKEVVEMYSLFPKPILTAVVENQGRENSLPMINGNWILPNNEFYPQNILNKLDTITKRCGDQMGNAIINSREIRDRELRHTFNISAITRSLVSPSHSKVPKYLNVLSSSAYSVNNSEISNLLSTAYSTMNSQLKTRYPNCLQELQRYFNIQNVKTTSDLPKTANAILELLAGIEQNDAIVYLQEKGASLKAPTFPSNVIAGQAYDIRKNEILPAAPVLLEGRATSATGFALPSTINCEDYSTVPRVKKIFTIFDTSRQYFQDITRSILVGTLQSVANSTEIYNNLVKKSEVGYFVKDITCEENTNNYCFTVANFYEMFQFKLNIDGMSKLHQDFVRRVQNISPFNESSYESVEQWSSFFNDFGTHFVKQAEGGGRIEFTFSAPKTAPVRDWIDKMFKILHFMENPLEAVSLYKEPFSQPNFPCSVVFRGGSPEYHMTDLSKLTLEQGRMTIQKWKNSLQYSPAVFAKEIVPMSKLFKDYPGIANGILADKIQFALGRLLTATLKYVAPTIDPRILEELERKRKEAEEKKRQLELEMKRKQEEAERLRLVAIEEQKRREQAARELEARRRREQQLAEERQRRAQEERERRARAEEERLRRQREADRRRQEEELAWQRERERRHREEMWRRQMEWEEEQRRRYRSSCLKQGTQILMADYSSRAVENLKIGDVLLDKDMKPTKLVGISYEFLLTQRFYGFDNKTFFFTDTHLFAGPSEEKHTNMQLYTTSKASLFAQNPLLEHLNVSEFRSPSTEEKTTLYKFHSVSHRKVLEEEVHVFIEPKVYPEETLIYFLQVDSPSGTYFAEGFVCRHEVPPLWHWPNTMAMLFSLFGTTGFEAVGQLKYTLETVHFIDKLSDNIQRSVVVTINNYFNNSRQTLAAEHTYFNHDQQKCVSLELTATDIDMVVGRIFGNPTLAALGMEIYGGAGSITSQFLDNADINLTSCQIEKVQHLFMHTIKEQISNALNVS